MRGYRDGDLDDWFGGEDVRLMKGGEGGGAWKCEE